MADVGAVTEERQDGRRGLSWRRGATGRERSSGGAARRLGWLEMVIVVVSGVAVGGAFHVSTETDQTLARTLPLARAGAEMKTALALSHLRLEERLAGDAGVNVYRDVHRPLERADRRCRAMLVGGELAFGRVEAVRGPGREDAALLCQQIDKLKELTAARLAAESTSGVGTSIHRAYEASFNTAMEMVDSDREAVDAAIDADRALLGRLNAGFILLLLVLFAGLAGLVNRHRWYMARRNVETAHLASIVSSSDDAIMATTPDGVITSWNQGAERLYGFAAEEVVGRSAEMLLPPSRRAEGTVVARALAGEVIRGVETERLRKDGSLVDIALTASPIVAGTALEGFSVVARDITQAKQAEVVLAAARDQAVEASRMKSEFLATMSHEIRTPMNAVVGLTGLLLTTPLDDRQREYAEGVQGGVDALLGVINDILDFSKIEAGRVDLETIDFDVRLIVEEVAGLVAEGARRKGVEVLAWCHPGLPAAVAGDAGRLRQILLNLAGNAVKFTDHGEILLRAEPARQTSGAVRFEVVDTGIGISPAARDRLFEPFSQADASTTRRYGGTGLGLTICNRLVTAMGGQLGLESQVGRGSTFWFELALPEADAVVAPASPAGGLLDGVAVLVVDDNATNRLIIETQLRIWGMKPDLCVDARSALGRLREMAVEGRPYRLAVLDMHMEGMNGLELAQRISADAELSGTGLVLLTSSSSVDPEEARRAGVARLLTKPVRQSPLHDALVHTLSPVGERDSAGAEATRQGDSPRGHLLVVEDNPANQMVALGILSQLGWTADVVGNGREAVEAVGRSRYAAVLMDCQMPEMDGFTAATEIRRAEQGRRRVPIIAMTASVVKGDRERCLAAGMDDYVPKPVTPEAVAAALSRWVIGAVAAGSPAEGGKAGPGAAVTDGVVDPVRLQLLRRMGPAGGSIFVRMVDAFLSDAVSGLAALGEAVLVEDGEAVRQEAHRIRGAAANLGAMSMAELCEELESIGTSGDLSDARGLLRRAEAELDVVSGVLRAACSGTPV